MEKKGGGERRKRKDKGGAENDLMHPLSKIPGYATGPVDEQTLSHAGRVGYRHTI